MKVYFVTFPNELETTMRKGANRILVSYYFLSNDKAVDLNDLMERMKSRDDKQGGSASSAGTRPARTRKPRAH